MQSVRDYLMDSRVPKKWMYLSLIALAMRSAAKSCIIPIQDWLGYDNKARMNKPSTIGINWRWRVQESELSDELNEQILAFTKRYGRMNWFKTEAELKAEEEAKKAEEAVEKEAEEE